jgi:hypothetical protein
MGTRSATLCRARAAGRFLLVAVALLLVLPLSARAFNPAYQSAPGSCAQNTESVARAVGDLHANGVLGVYARTLGVQASDRSLVRAVRRVLVIGVVRRSAVTANHGCDGHGGVFSVGGRTLYAGETVGVKMPARLQARACAGPAPGCVAVAIVAHVVFPTNCWNLNSGGVAVLVYVHRQKPKQRKPKRPDPAASVAFSCSAGGVVVSLSNGRSATESASFTVNGIAYGPLVPGASKKVVIAIASGTTDRVTVSSGGRALIDDRAFTNTCTTPPVTAPSASAAVSCSAGAVVVTLSNGASATEAASFTVNGAPYGPVAPGGSQTASVPVAPGATVSVTVISGDEELIADQPFVNTCTATPAATATLACTTLFGGGTVSVALSNASTAELPASFVVTATGNQSGGFGPTTYGPLAPGADQTVSIPVDTSGNDIAVSVTSGGAFLLSTTFPGGCPSMISL